MISLDELRAFTEEAILPAVSVDGGEIRVDRLEGETVVFGAYAECALCPACNENYIWWIAGRLEARFGRPFQVRIEKHPPYYRED